MTVSCPGANCCCMARADTHPQEVRTLLMLTVWFVVLTSRKGCETTVPWGTEPKSRESSSKRLSAQPARAGPAAVTRTKKIRQCRTIGAVPVEGREPLKQVLP